LWTFTIEKLIFSGATLSTVRGWLSDRLYSTKVTKDYSIIKSGITIDYWVGHIHLVCYIHISFNQTNHRWIGVLDLKVPMCSFKRLVNRNNFTAVDGTNKLITNLFQYGIRFHVEPIIHISKNEDQPRNLLLIKHNFVSVWVAVQGSYWRHCVLFYPFV